MAGCNDILQLLHRGPKEPLSAHNILALNKLGTPPPPSPQSPITVIETGLDRGSGCPCQSTATESVLEVQALGTDALLALGCGTAWQVAADLHLQNGDREACAATASRGLVWLEEEAGAGNPPQPQVTPPLPPPPGGWGSEPNLICLAILDTALQQYSSRTREGHVCHWPSGHGSVVIRGCTWGRRSETIELVRSLIFVNYVSAIALSIVHTLSCSVFKCDDLLQCCRSKWKASSCRVLPTK